MSSRNRYLSPSERNVAPILYKGFKAAQSAFETGSVTSRKELFAIVESIVQEQTSAKLEYLSLAEPYLLEEVDVVSETEGAILSGAIRVGTTRIIDNVLLGMKREKL